jgi:hypothetical protein
MDSTHEQGLQGANLDNSGEAVQPNSFDPGEFEKRLLSRVQEMITDPRTVQSVKDKTLAEIKKDKGFKDFLAEYQSMKNKGMSDAEIAQEARLRELEERLKPTLPATPAPGKVEVQATNDPALQMAANLGLDNEPEVVGLLARDASTEEKLLAMATIIQRKKQVNVNPAIAAQPSGGSTPPVNLAQLENNYKQEVMQARGNRSAILAIQQKYQSQGLNTANVVFTL